MSLKIILLVLAAVGMVEGINVSKSALLFVDPVGPGWYLFFIAGLLLVCAVALLGKRIIRRKTGLKEARLSLLQGPVGRTLLLLVFYAATMPLLGYVIASGIFFIGVQRVFGERSWPRCAAIGLSITGCFYFVFSYLAGMPLP